VVAFVAGLVAVQAYGGAVGLGAGLVDFGPEITARLPFGSALVAAVALVVIVAVPMTVAAWYLSTGNPRAHRAAIAAGALLVSWIVVQVAVIQSFSWLQPVMAVAGLLVFVSGLTHKEVR
jgi:hypothetical protein